MLLEHIVVGLGLYRLDRIKNYALSAFFIKHKICIGLDVVSLRNLCADYQRVELADCTESYVITVICRPPIRESAVVYRTGIFVHNKARSALVVIAYVIVITVTHIIEADGLVSK